MAKNRSKPVHRITVDEAREALIDVSPTDQLIKDVEAQSLEAVREVFGDLDPLNFKANRRKRIERK